MSIEPKEILPPPARTHTVPRKPVASATHTSTWSTDISPPPAHHSTTLPSRLRTRWSLLPRRTRTITICVSLALLALILGLSIGLTAGKHKAQNLPLPSDHGGPYSGDLTYYEPGLGACGVPSSSADDIVSVSHYLFDAQQTGSDPNQNPLCGKKIRVKRTKEGVGERSVDLTVVDRCVGCKATDIDVSLSVFDKLADQDLGRVTCQWSWLA